MTVDQVEKYLYWADEYGNIWKRMSYCLQPTVEFARMVSPGPSNDKSEYRRLGGAIGCPLLQDLKPIEMPTPSREDT